MQQPLSALSSCASWRGARSSATKAAASLIREVGRELGVRAVLLGRVLQFEERLIIRTGTG